MVVQGSYSDLLANKGAFADFLLEYMVGDDETEELGDIVGDLQQVYQCIRRTINLFIA